MRFKKILEKLMKFWKKIRIKRITIIKTSMSNDSMKQLNKDLNELIGKENLIILPDGSVDSFSKEVHWIW